MLCSKASLVSQTVKNLPAMREAQVLSLGQEDHWRREWQPTPVYLPGEFHGQRSLLLPYTQTLKMFSLSFTGFVNLVLCQEEHLPAEQIEFLLAH